MYTNKDEHKFQTDFKENITKYNGHCPSLVASMFMAGMPDLIVNTTTGYTFYMELKVWKNLQHPQEASQVHALLHGPQIGVIRKTLWPRNILCPIVAQLCDAPTASVVVYKDSMAFIPNDLLAKIAAKASSMTYFTEALFS